MPHAPNIPAALISDYVMAKYYLICAQFDLSKTATVVQTGKNEFEITSFTEAMLKLQKNVLTCWEPIWEIVSKNSERLVTNPEQDLVMMLLTGRQRKPPKGEPPAHDHLFARYENPSRAAEPGEI
jgi:hypothetical protein